MLDSFISNSLKGPSIFRCQWRTSQPAAEFTIALDYLWKLVCCNLVFGVILLVTLLHVDFFRCSAVTKPAALLVSVPPRLLSACLSPSDVRRERRRRARDTRREDRHLTEWDVTASEKQIQQTSAKRGVWRSRITRPLFRCRQLLCFVIAVWWAKRCSWQLLCWFWCNLQCGIRRHESHQGEMSLRTVIRTAP